VPRVPEPRDFDASHPEQPRLPVDEDGWIGQCVLGDLVSGADLTPGVLKPESRPLRYTDPPSWPSRACTGYA
jgi:hypothetical protein